MLDDAAQAFGATYQGRSLGSFGHATATSFFPAKPLGCYGDGGAVFTDDDQLAETLLSLRVHGHGSDKYDNMRIGMTSRLDTIQAAILIEKLKIFPDEIAARERAARYYAEKLSDVVTVPTVPAGSTSVWAQYTIRIAGGRRDKVAAAPQGRRHSDRDLLSDPAASPAGLQALPGGRGRHGGERGSRRRGDQPADACLSRRRDPGPHRRSRPPRAGAVIDPSHGIQAASPMNWRQHHIRLRRLEAEAIAIMRETVASFANPVMLYSIGKDSSVMLHVAQKAFAPGKPPFPLLHVDTTWKFREMIAFRDETAARLGMDLIVHVNEEGLKRGISPVASGSAIHTQVMKTEGLRQAMDKYRFDAAFGGARRDEEKSRAKERIFSHRSASHGWDPRNQRPELWRIFNTRLKTGESMRVFPLSNWTELDVWDYIRAEEIPVVPLYFAKERPVVTRDDMLIMVDDERLPLKAGEKPQMLRVRFRTLGCYPLSGAIRSDADTLDAIIAEMRSSTSSERQGRLIDHDEAGSMEKKKREGYF